MKLTDLPEKYREQIKASKPKPKKGKRKGYSLEYLKDKARSKARNEDLVKFVDPRFIAEHHFCECRDFSFDHAILELKIAYEVEGVTKDSNKSRHTSIEGFTKDMEKYNIAESQGWHVIKCTPATFEENFKYLELLINLKTNENGRVL